MLNYLKICKADLSIFHSFFIHLIMYLCEYSYLFYTWGYNPMLLYLFCCSHFSTVEHWELFS